jgi:hypothetical protein
MEHFTAWNSLHQINYTLFRNIETLLRQIINNLAFLHLTNKFQQAHIYTNRTSAISHVAALIRQVAPVSLPAHSTGGTGIVLNHKVKNKSNPPQSHSD